MLNDATESKWSRNLSIDSYQELNRLNFIEQQRHLLELRRQDQLFANPATATNDNNRQFLDANEEIIRDFKDNLNIDTTGKGLEANRLATKMRAASASIVMRESRQQRQRLNRTGGFRPSANQGDANRDNNHGQMVRTSRSAKLHHEDQQSKNDDHHDDDIDYLKDRDSDTDLSLVSFSSMQSISSLNNNYSNDDTEHQVRKIRRRKNTHNSNNNRSSNFNNNSTNSQKKLKARNNIAKRPNLRDEQVKQLKAVNLCDNETGYIGNNTSSSNNDHIDHLANERRDIRPVYDPLVEALNQEQMAEFASEPVPPNLTYQCLIVRDKTGLNKSFYPTYYLVLQAIINNNYNCNSYGSPLVAANMGSSSDKSTSNITTGIKMASTAHTSSLNRMSDVDGHDHDSENDNDDENIGNDDRELLTDSFSNASIDEERDDLDDEDDIMVEVDSGSGIGHCGSISRDISDDFKDDLSYQTTLMSNHSTSTNNINKVLTSTFNNQRSNQPLAASNSTTESSSQMMVAAADQIRDQQQQYRTHISGSTIDEGRQDKRISAPDNTMEIRPNRIILNDIHPSLTHATIVTATPTTATSTTTATENHQHHRPSIILAGRRRKKTKTYLIALDEHDITRKKSICKLKSNVLGTQFNAIRIVSCKDDGGIHQRYNVASISYETNVLGFKGPRKMNIVIPDMNYLQVSDLSLYEESKKANSQCIIQLRNKAPTWNEESESYVLNFHGRVTQASVKNFQLIHIPKLVSAISDGTGMNLEVKKLIGNTLVDQDGNAISSSMVDLHQDQPSALLCNTLATTSKSSNSATQQVRNRSAERLKLSLNQQDPYDNQKNETITDTKLNLGDQSATKNHQMSFTSYSDFIVMQFGRISEREFTCDVSHPLSLLQAFSIALSSFDSKLACE